MKVYSNSPFADKLGELDSGNFAEWGWDGTSATSATGNRFIFKYHPTLTFTAKVLPEPDQPKNQYREYEKELTIPAGVAKFMMTYNGSTFDIYPVDNMAKKMLLAGDAAKNVDVESQALFAAFKEMGITLDDLDGVYTHFDRKN